MRIDHAINSKFQLMGHYLHDAMTQTFFPPLWGDSTYPTVGTAMNNPSYSAAIKLTQTYFAQPAQRNRLPLQRQQDHSHSDHGPWRRRSCSPAVDRHQLLPAC